MGTKLDPRRWRQVGDVVEHLCKPCNAWLAHTPDNFHKHKDGVRGLQDYCKTCMCNIVATQTAARRQRHKMRMLRALAWARSLPPLLALDRITEAWAER